MLTLNNFAERHSFCQELHSQRDVDLSTSKDSSQEEAEVVDSQVAAVASAAVAEVASVEAVEVDSQVAAVVSVEVVEASAVAVEVGSPEDAEPHVVVVDSEAEVSDLTYSSAVRGQNCSDRFFSF